MPIILNLDEKRWLETLPALESARDNRTVSGESVRKWLESWGTENELPPPKIPSL